MLLEKNTGSLVWYGYGLIWISSECLVGQVLSWTVTNEQWLFHYLKMIHDITSLHAYYVMGICKLYLILTHVLPHITYFASNLRHGRFNFGRHTICFTVKLSVALTTDHYKANQGINQVNLWQFRHLVLNPTSLLNHPRHQESAPLHLEAKTKVLDNIIENLELIEPHLAFFILKNCLSIPKFKYLLRSAPCFKYKEELEVFDKAIKTNIEKICNVFLEKKTGHKHPYISDMQAWASGPLRGKNVLVRDLFLAPLIKYKSWYIKSFISFPILWLEINITTYQCF